MSEKDPLLDPQDPYRPASWEMPGLPATRDPWWRRFLAWCRRVWSGEHSADPDDASELEPVPRFEPPEWLNIHEPHDTFTVKTPAKGDAFMFLLRIRCDWCVHATSTDEEKEAKRDEVRAFIADKRRDISDRIEEIVRPIARRFPPYRPAEAEAAINKELVGCFNDGDVQVKVRIWVDVADEVRHDLQVVWRNRLVEDARGDAREAHVELVAVLQDRWRNLLISGLEGLGEVNPAKVRWIAPYALALAEDDKNAAAYLKGMLENRVSHAEQLLNQLGDLVMHYHQIEDIEFAFRSDSALRAVLAHLGVPVPGGSGQASEFLGDADE